MRTGLPSEKKFLHLAMGLFLLGLIAFAPAQPWAQAPQPPPDPNTGAEATTAGSAQGTQAAGPSSAQAATAGQYVNPGIAVPSMGNQVEMGPTGTWQPIPNPSCDLGGPAETTLSQTAQGQGAQIAFTKATSNRLYPRGYGPKQTKLTTCVAMLQNAYMILSSLFSAPFDPLHIVTIVLNVVVNIIVTQLLNFVCAMMVQLLNDAQNFVKDGAEVLMNLICIPLPKWNLNNIFSITAPPGGHCGGNPFNQAPNSGLNVVVPGVTPYTFKQ